METIVKIILPFRWKWIHYKKGILLKEQIISCESRPISTNGEYA